MLVMRNACKHLVIKNKLLGSQHFDANQMEDLIPKKRKNEKDEEDVEEDSSSHGEEERNSKKLKSIVVDSSSPAGAGLCD